MQSGTGSVAAPGSFPVDVLMKSAPAAIASSDARRTLSYTFAYRPERNAPRSITMSTSSAPCSTTQRTSSSFASSGDCPDGNAVATEATLTPVHSTRATAAGTRFGYTQMAATDGTFGSDGS